MPDSTSMLLLLCFLCLMTGLFSPDGVIKRAIPNLKYRKMILLFLGGIVIVSLIAYTTSLETSLSEENQIVFLDQSSTEGATSSEEIKEIDEVLIELLEMQVSEDGQTLWLELAIENQSAQSISYNPYQFLLETNDGKKIVPSIQIIQDQIKLESGELHPGERIQGGLTYTISSDGIPMSLEYRPVNSSPSHHLIFELPAGKVMLTDDGKSDEMSVIKTVGVKDIIKQGGIEYQVLDVNHFDQLGNQKPKVGYEFLKVELAFKNVSQNNLFVFPYHFEVHYGKQNKVKPVISLIEEENLLGISELVNGGMITGNLVFEVHKSASLLTLTYSNPLYFQSNLIAIDLNSLSEEEELLTPSVDLGDDWRVGNHLIPSLLEGMEMTTYSYELKNETLYSHTREGKQFILIDVSLKNTGEQKRKYTAFDFKLLTSTGQLLMPSLTLVDNQSEFKSGELAFEEETTGILLFEVNQCESTFSIIYSPSNWVNAEKIIIPLN